MRSRRTPLGSSRARCPIVLSLGRCVKGIFDVVSPIEGTRVGLNFLFLSISGDGNIFMQILSCCLEHVLVTLGAEVADPGFGVSLRLDVENVVQR